MGRHAWFALALVPVALADPPFEQMRQGTVLVQVEFSVRDQEGREGRARGHGTGIVIGDRWVSTNWHVCCNLPPGGQLTKMIVWITPTISANAVARWSSKRKDLGILELDRPAGRPVMTLAPQSVITEGRKVYAMGFPGSADGIPDAEGRKTVKITEGIIGAKVRGREEDEQLAGTRLYQHSSAISPGNSGGPLFDECGRVVGVNVASPKTAVLAPGPDGKTRVVAVPSSSGIYWAIQADELIEQVRAMQIPSPVAAQACAVTAPVSGTSSIMIFGQVGTAALALIAVVLAATRRGREAVKRVTTYRRGERRAEQAPAAAAKMAARSKPLLRGVSGYYQDTELEMSAEPWIFGRDPRAANLVFPPGTQDVSRRHCTIHFDQGRRKFVLEDNWSTNGTFMASGEAVKPGTTRELKSGDRFYVGARDNTFEVRLEE